MLALGSLLRSLLGLLQTSSARARSSTFTSVLLVSTLGSTYFGASGAGSSPSCSPRVAVRSVGALIGGRRGPSPNGGPLWQTPPWLRAFVRSPRVRSFLSGWLVLSGLGGFPSVLVVPASVLGQLTLWLSLWFGPTVTATTHNMYIYNRRLAYTAWRRV